MTPLNGSLARSVFYRQSQTLLSISQNVSLTKRSPGVTSSSSSTPHVIAMVGLPARGKTYISKKLTRYLKWLGVNTRVFNLGQYRRKMDGYDKPKHDFFDPNNPEGVKIRMQVCKEALRDLFSWIDAGGEVRNHYDMLKIILNSFPGCYSRCYKHNQRKKKVSVRRNC